MNKIPFVTRLYVWSIVFEPLLFFILWDRWTAGIGGNLSRILQILVLILLLLQFLMKPRKLQIINLLNPLYLNFAIYFGLAVFAGLIGLASGAYHINLMYSIIDGQSQFSRLLNSATIRPLFEYGVFLYYFFYFVVMPRYMLRSKESVSYFFSIFKKVFFVSLFLGFINLFYNFIPRHFADGRLLGFRFHGLAGEPRQAFVYLFLGLAVLKLEAYIKGRSLSKLLIMIIILAAFLTQSTSGIIGIVVFLVFFSFDRLVTSALNGRRLILILASVVAVSILLYGAMISSDRFSSYWESASNLWVLLESKSELPYLMKVQSSDIYPLYDLIVKARNLDILPVIIGSGLGSASAINNAYTPFATGEMMNPNSQLTRTLFESGIIGTFFFISSFVYPVKLLTRQMAEKDRFVFIALIWLLIGCFMGVRSSALFIFLGIFIAVFAPFTKRKETA